MSKKIVGLVLVIILGASLCSFALADTLPAMPTLKLTVAQDPVTYFTIYAAQLSFIPAGFSTPLLAEFFISDLYQLPVFSKPFASSYFDNTGKAVLSIQIPPGEYVSVARTRIGNTMVGSNRVTYKVTPPWRPGF